MISTIVDYSVLVGTVELAHLGPVAATPIAAFAGAVTNFTLNRSFTYRAADRPFAASCFGSCWCRAVASG